MRIHINHSTFYKYDRYVPYTAQLIRLHPRSHQGQQVLSWRVVSENGRVLPSTFDGYGNVLHMLTRDRMHDTATIIAEGEVETTDTTGIVNGAVETLPPIYYLRQTPHTQPDDAIRVLAGEAKSAFASVGQLHGLMSCIRGHVAYELGATSSGTTAAEALAQGRGVCQDHTHIFLSAARVLGYPARYISGYLWEQGRTAESDAGHAWAEALVEGLGWVGFDVANGICPDGNYVRVAIGLDFLEAAPIRGVRRGEGEEEMRVTVDMRQSHQVQQQ